MCYFSVGLFDKQLELKLQMPVSFVFYVQSFVRKRSSFRQQIY